MKKLGGRKILFSLLALGNVNALLIFDKLGEESFLWIFMGIFTGLIGSNVLTKAVHGFAKNKLNGGK